MAALLNAYTEAPEIVGDAEEKTLWDFLKARMTSCGILLLDLQSAFSQSTSSLA